MKKKNSSVKYPEHVPQALELNDRPMTAEPETMVRTQVYLTRSEHEFLQTEAERRGEPMAAYLRRIIDERMNVPEDAWATNPMLDPTPEVEGWKGQEDGALNHDHYVYGGERKYQKEGSKWVLQAPSKE